MNGTESRLCRNLGYEFSDYSLLQRALTHRSVSANNNERLEFLGDAILNMAIAEILYESVPKAAEGTLTRLRADLVRKETLAQVSRHLEVGPAIQLGQGELKSGGRTRDSILADAFEAVIGALYLEAGMDVTRSTLRKIFSDRVNAALEGGATKDPKTRLQEFLQAQGLPLPNYEVVVTSGAAHQRQFTVSCEVSGIDGSIEGSGNSRRRAEQNAAMKAVNALGLSS